MSDWFEGVLEKLGFEIEKLPEEGRAREPETIYDPEPEKERKPRKGGLFGGGRDDEPEKEDTRPPKVQSVGIPGKGDIFIVSPTLRSDAKIICDELRRGMTVVVNVEGLDESETTRLFDFVQGSVYALDGQIQQIQQNVIVVAPRGIEIQPDSAVSEAKSSEDYSYIDDDEELDYGFR